MRYLSSISLALIVLMALACTATPATPAPTPLPTPDVPLLDEETVVLLTVGFLGDRRHGHFRSDFCFEHRWSFEAQYLGKDIWVSRITGVSEVTDQRICTFTVHDKGAHVILPQ
jgi:hypothetical protein